MIALLASVFLITNLALGATKTWTPAGSDTNWSTTANWSPSGVLAADDLRFINSGAGTGLTTNNAVDGGFSATVRSLTFNHTNSSHGTLITAPVLTISGTAGTPYPLFVGTGDDGDINATNYTTISGTALTINNPNSPIIIRQAGSVSASTHRAFLNLSGLNTFTANVQAFYTGWENDGLISDRRPCGTVFFARTNYITCTTSGIGFQIGQVVQTAGAANTNRLGQVNVFNVNSMRIGGAKTANTMLNFNSGLVNPSVTFRNAAGIGRQTAWYIGDDATGSSSSASTAIMDLSGGTVDALVVTIYVGRSQPSSNTGDGTGTLILKQGTIDTDTMEIGYQLQTGGSVGRGTVRVDGGLLKINKNMRLGRAVAGSSDAGSGLLVINSGTVQVAGDVLDGGYPSTITVTNGGVLDLQPAGDPAPGNIGVRILNLGAGTLTNYSSLGASNLNVLAPAAGFTVYPGQGLAPMGRGVIGALAVSTDLTLTNASLYFDLADPFSTSDRIDVTGTLTLGGTNFVNIAPVGTFGAGTYAIMTYTAALSGNANNLKLAGAIADSRYNLSFDTTTVPNVNLIVAGGPAANLTWSGDGTGNLWDLKGALNWNGGSGANTEKFYNLDTVSFDDTGSATPAVNLVGALLPGTLTISGTKNYTFGGSGKISGPASLNQNSSGVLTLLTTNDYTGLTYINSGTVQVGNGTTADGALGSGDIYNSGTLIFNSAATQYVPGAINGSGAIVKRGPGVLQLAGADTFSVAVTNEAGTLMAGNSTALGDTAFGTTINDGTTLDLGGQNIGGEPVVASGTGVNGAGAIINSGSSAGALQNLTLVGPTTFGGSASWIVGPPTLNGLQANSNKVTKIGANSFQLSNGDSGFIADPGFGDLDIQAGTFTLYGYVGLGDPAKTLLIRSNATLEIDNTGDSLTSKLIVLEDGATVTSTLPNRLMPQYCSVPGPITLGGANGFNIVFTDTVFLNGEVSGSGSLIKRNAGLLVLNASNSFTGDLRIEAGTVALTNDASVTKAANIVLAGGTLDVSGRSDLTLTLASGQGFKGNGTVMGIVRSPSGTTVEPGASIGAINVSGNVQLRGTTTMEMSKVGGVKSSDQINVTGLLDLGGTFNVTFAGEVLATGDKFTLFTAAAFANGFTTVNLPNLPSVVWTNNTALDGTIEVLSAAPATPPSISFAEAGGAVTLSWPLDYAGYTLYGQTNPITVGLSTNWGIVPGVNNNSVTLPRDPNNGSVFFQLRK